MMFKGTTIRLRAVAAQPRASRSRMIQRPQASTFWTLMPRKEKTEFFRLPDSPIDLTDVIGRKRVCSIGAKDYASHATDTIDLTVVEHGGVHLIFESESEAHAKSPLDSPAALYVTDIDSDCDVLVDGVTIQKGKRTKLRPGAHIVLGEHSYTVERNVVAHA